MTNEYLDAIEQELAECFNGGRGFKYGRSHNDDGTEFTSVEQVAAHLAETARLSGANCPGKHCLDLWTVHVDDPENENGSLIIAHTGNGPTSAAHARFFALAPWAIKTLVTDMRGARDAITILNARMRELETIVDAVASADAWDAIGSIDVGVAPYRAENGKMYSRRCITDAARKALGR